MKKAKINMLDINKAADNALRSFSKPVYRREIHQGMLHVFNTRAEYVAWAENLREQDLV
jgi:hypothetical protein